MTRAILLCTLLIGCAASSQPPQVIREVVYVPMVAPKPKSADTLPATTPTGMAVRAYRAAEKGVPKIVNDPKAPPDKIREAYAREKEARLAVQALINQDGHRTTAATDRAFAAIRALVDLQNSNEPDDTATKERQ